MPVRMGAYPDRVACVCVVAIHGWGEAECEALRGRSRRRSFRARTWREGGRAWRKAATVLSVEWGVAAGRGETVKGGGLQRGRSGRWRRESGRAHRGGGAGGAGGPEGGAEGGERNGEPSEADQG